MSFLCAMAAPASPPSASSSSSPLLCFHCRQETSEFKKGWKLRAGGYAGLCIRCGSAYEEGKFCDIFHLDADGWRDCATCGKMVHCGCIMSFHVYTVLDFGGVCCIKCFKNSNVAPNQDPSQAPNQDPSFNATPEILQKQKLGDPSDKVMTGIDCGEDPTASLGSPVCHELPQEKNVKPLVCISPPQKQDSPAHFTEQFSTDSSNEGDTSCETLIDSETSEGDSSGKTCSYSQNLSEESDDEVQEIFRPDADPKMARLVIPKKSAEAYFPKVTEAHGFPIVFQDTQRKEWEFNLRFWVNCNSKMYVLEGLKEYMTLMQWQAGDKVTFHRIEPEGKFLIATKKIVKPPPKEQPSTIG
ncbi:B3 domain-containing protein Os07g0563300-like isoform X3 [Quercus lobata]|uniref:B3 domain-containing protein Os07g0563300-like isoform X3 n=1 Tax=Quercus lobata TaxID=97700 RepID=UPI001246EF49|nr:B3 domain-containing protein Os07g0563300-like isoform X3 [Quercus lobata]